MHTRKTAPSRSYDKFLKTIKRCETLIRSYQILHAVNQKNNKIPAPKDIVRGGVVLAVAALDAYVTDIFAEKLVAYLKKYKPNAQLIGLLSEAGLDTAEALTLIQMDRPYRKIRTLMQNYYATYTTQKFDVIDSIFEPYHLTCITSHAARKSGTPSIKKSVEKLISRRHSIAHSGDYNSHKRIVDIDEDGILRRINHLEKLVTEMDKIICNRI